MQGLLRTIDGAIRYVGIGLIGLVLFSGVSEAALARRLHPDDGWAETLASAVVSLAAGLALWCDWPIAGARAVGLLVGASLISTGWAIMSAHRALESAAARLRVARDAVASGVARARREG